MTALVNRASTVKRQRQRRTAEAIWQLDRQTLDVLRELGTP